VPIRSWIPLGAQPAFSPVNKDISAATFGCPPLQAAARPPETEVQVKGGRRS